MTRVSTRKTEVSGVITLLTDFGMADPYVGIMKGVMLGINPDARLVDISHGIQPGNIFEAGVVLKESYAYFPRGTVHVAVVDPGVGTSRRALVLLADGHFFVAPDNGLLWPIISKQPTNTLIHLTNPAFFLHPISNTFHGRDIFAPVAAHLALGASPFEMGNPIDDPIKLSIPLPMEHGQKLKGQVIRVDRFGNLITNIDVRTLTQYAASPLSNVTVTVGPMKIKGISSTYADVPTGKELALIGSSGFLEISVNQGRADRKIDPCGMVVGTSVWVDKTGA
ncbi:MAG: SAM-dependent chlorinase/fluorinase [Deltaproteobacteria bacterium]|nr:SAM-dependent chlorinase/fluorinase [Deltaproteobacteria bacterium]MBW2083236.1 SAM-dependent chlorinase/fluorinase [Deltaproteobacteria bacterium]HDM09291.1 hypothetical protein [Desulfobacteraceae bacterium]